MHTIESLQAKRANLVAQREQLNANMNAMHGAIAIVDELLGELQAEQAAEKAEAEKQEAAKWPQDETRKELIYGAIARINAGDFDEVQYDDPRLPDAPVEVVDAPRPVL